MMLKKYSKAEAAKIFESFDSNYEDRVHTFSQILSPYFNIIDEYGQMFSRLSYLTGFVSPKSHYESIQRDLSADVFDFLHETKYLIQRGHSEFAYPLARRAFESLTLMIAFYYSDELANDWEEGKQIPNHKVRAIIDKHKEIGGESKESLQELYKYFSRKVHPNKDAIPDRFIGSGNYFALGPLPEPSLLSLVDLCCEILGLWFWLLAFTWYYNLEYVNEFDTSFKENYIEMKINYSNTKEWLINEQKHLTEEQMLKTQRRGN